MKIIPLVIYGLFISSIVYGQSLQSQSINPASNYSEGASASLSYSIGNTVSATYSNSEGTLSQGYNESVEVVSLITNPKIEIKADVFPVPATNDLTIQVSDNTEPITVTLFNTEGKAVRYEIMEAGETIMPLGNVLPGQYLLQLKTVTDELIQTFKVIKQ